MKKKARSKSVPKIDPYIEGLMAKLVERLIQIEKKIDRLASQTASRGSGPAPGPVQQPPRHERTMYEAICADCSKVCEVPFRPSEDRKVYCKSCWARRKGVPPPGMPVLTPVALPPKPASKLSAAALSQTAVRPASKKAKKAKPAKKTKKKK